MAELQRNVLGGILQACCFSPKTGFFRDGYCRTDELDYGTHTVCTEMTESFLQFSKEKGNDLSTPHPEWDFPGLVPGDKWCLCALRWKEAFDAGVAPKIFLESCHEKTLELIPLEDLLRYAVEPPLH